MRPRFAARLMGLNFCVTILLSACLLFQVQPIISKFILPWFGGSPAVWTTCMVFFQTVLCAGYAYAHWSQRLRTPKLQAIVHVILLLSAVALLPIAPTTAWKPTAGAAPTWRILGLLAATVGLPYFALSTTGPLVQTWFAGTFAGKSPYRLYALSNIGSLAALLSYPLVIEPTFELATQAGCWSIGFVVFALLAGASAVAAALAAPLAMAVPAREAASAPPPTWSTRLTWIGLSAFASMMLLATTNHVCQDVAVIPFLWVAPLSLYLLSFIICFDHERWYWRKAYALAALGLLLGVALVDQLITGGAGIRFTFTEEVTLYFAALFALCMTCHGELARLKPHPRYLTSFYMLISAGGALGGLFVSLLAPRIFTTFFEWKIGLMGGALLAGVVALVAAGNSTTGQRRRLALLTPVLLLVFVCVNCAPRWVRPTTAPLEICTRTFYGTANVSERDVDDPEQHRLVVYSGRIMHGLQFVKPEKRSQPTVYYGRTSGMGLLLARLGSKPDARVGIVGLGCGTTAAYCQPGQRFRFYEINPQVIRLAREHFSYLSGCRGQQEVVLGDARLSLEQEPPQQFDVLILDAFSGDAVPTHLLSREAMDIYRKHLKPAGEIAVHISNRYLDLDPVVRGLAAYGGFEALHIFSAGDVEQGLSPAEWMILSRDADTLAALRPAAGSEDLSRRAPVLWTDGHSNLLQILK